MTWMLLLYHSPIKPYYFSQHNRPLASAKSADTVLPSNKRFNIFLITDFEETKPNYEVTQLSDLKYGDARFPT